MLLERLAERNIGSLRQMHDLQRQLNSLLSPESYNDRTYPPLNVWASDQGAIVELEVPGVNLDDIEITAVADTLTLKGEKKAEESQNDPAYYHQERYYGNFARTVRLPFRIETDKVKAQLSRGILKITAPRAEADKPKKITVKSANI